MNTQSQTGLVLEGVRAGYGDTVVLEDISLTLPPRATLAVLGRNGVGKTTLLATIMGRTSLHGGSLQFGSRTVGALPAYRRSRLGIRIRAAGTGDLPFADGRGKPYGRVAAGALVVGPRLRSFPITGRSTWERRNRIVRRRTADAEYRARADGKSGAAAAGRAVGGIGAGDHRCRAYGHRASEARRQPCDPAGRAARAHRSRSYRESHRPGPGANRSRRRKRTASCGAGAACRLDGSRAAAGVKRGAGSTHAHRTGVTRAAARDRPCCATPASGLADVARGLVAARPPRSAPNQ